MEGWEYLQSGSDIRGIAIEAPGHPVNFTPDEVQAIARAFGQWLRTEKKTGMSGLKVAVGMDSRLSGPELAAAVMAGLLEQGCLVFDCGLSTTPAMFMTTVMDNYQCDAAIMVTASHLPYYYNGLKLFTTEGGCEKEDIKAVLRLAAASPVTYTGEAGQISKANLIIDYANLLVHTIQQRVDSKTNYWQPLAGFKIVMDAGNGAGGFFAERVLRPLGADITGSQFLEPDGNFPNHLPNPENQQAMASLKTAVETYQADIGIIFDADVDRAAIVSRDGREINKNALVALASAIVLTEHPRTVIVTDSITSSGLSEFIHDLGGIHHRFKRGYKNVINEAKRLNANGEACWLAIETSGHAAFQENYFLDDGAYLIAKLLVKAAQIREQGKEIQNLIAKLKMPCESTEYRIAISDSNFHGYGVFVLHYLKEYVKTVAGWSIVPNNYEGIRVAADSSSGDGWFLLRLSLHEPVMALNIESDRAGGVKSMWNILKPFLGNFPGLNI